MNATLILRTVTFPPWPAIPQCETCAVLADMKLDAAMEYLAQWTEAYFAAPERDPGQRAKITAAMVAIAHARNMLEPLMVERV